VRAIAVALALFASACAAPRPPEVVHLGQGTTFTTCDLGLVTSANRDMTSWECTPVHFEEARR
jgi:hypothetical protein